MTQIHKTASTVEDLIAFEVSLCPADARVIREERMKLQSAMTQRNWNMEPAEFRAEKQASIAAQYAEAFRVARVYGFRAAL
jgi:hypothetical protein